MKKIWLPYDLQFFADEGAEESDVAEQTEEETTDADDGTEEESEEEPEEDDRDSIYAAARRRAESEARAKYEKEQVERDTYYARMCEGTVNPETGAPITTEAEYREALEAQERINMSQQLQSKGIDPEILNQFVKNNPAIREAERLVEETKQTKAKEQIAEDIKTIMNLDKSFADEDELTSSDEFQNAVKYALSHPGVLLSEAYKLVNFDTLRNAGARAAKQAAINEAKGKGHLTSPKGAKGDDEISIPEGDLNKWKRFYPEKSIKELNALYAKVHHN
jgi:hypothetical protein